MKSIEILAKNLKAYREEHGLTQREFSEMAKIPLMELVFMEQAFGDTLLRELDNIAVVMGITVSELLKDGEET